MPARDLPARPNIDQYKKQAKELLAACRAADPDAWNRLRAHHPRFAAAASSGELSLTDAQLVIAREHGFQSWPRFAAHVETLRLAREVDAVTDPVSAFIVSASAPREGAHRSGTLEQAQMILARFPEVARSSIHTAAILGTSMRCAAFSPATPPWRWRSADRMAGIR